MTVLALMVMPLCSWNSAAATSTPTMGLKDSISQTIGLEQQKVMNVIKQQFCDFQRQEHRGASSGRDDGLVTQWMATLNDDGAWPDIDYADQTSGAWRTMNHMNRLVNLCVAYTSAQSQRHADANLSKTIHSALGHWLRNDYGNPNWWHREIGVPMVLSRAMLLLDGELSPEERATGIRIVARAVLDSPPSGGRGELTGQNRVWVAANSLTHGLIASDYALVQRSSEVIFEEVSIATQAGGAGVTATRTGPGQIILSTQEGVQPDYSFLQHGPLLQLGNYGLGFANDTVMWLTVLRGTVLAPGEEKIAIIKDYLLQGERPVVWKGVMDISSCGRQLGPRSPAGKGRSVIGAMQIAKVADASHADEYNRAIAQISSGAEAHAIPPENKYYWRADYLIHRRPDYCVSTKMNSERVYASELVNGENLQGLYMADGAMYVYRTGHEYEDIFPVWDWSRLPGVTSPITTDRNLLKPKNFKITNPNAFVGGVSDGQYGVAVLTLERDGLSAQKSWFYFDDQIVCLGAGISEGKGSRSIVTGVNQCLARGEVVYDEGRGPQTSREGRLDSSTLKWAWHDNIGYVFPTPQKVSLGNQKQSGSWKLVSASSSAEPVAQDVFSIWIDHGETPDNAQYGYVVLPGASQERLRTQAAAPDVAILENTSEIQAVRHAKLEMTQVVFHCPGMLEYGTGKTLAVDKPCVVILDEKANRLSVADPTQQLKEMTVTLDGVPMKHPFPQGAMAGSSSTVLHW